MPYQRDWVEDRARFKIMLAARQTGKSHGCGFEVALDAIETGEDWIILSRGERQARDFMRKVGLILDGIDETLIIAASEPTVKDQTVLTIELKSGALIRALPANADTARGFSANLVLDEFAFHEDPDAIWRAVFPIITNPLAGEKKLRIMSTPSGKNNKFFSIWDGGENLRWSRHKIDIYDAQVAGLFTPEQVVDLKGALDDPDGWAQEYECNFLEESTQYFSRALIESCIDLRCTTDCAPMYEHRARRVAGLDIGRRHDLSVLYTLYDDNGTWVTEEILTMARTAFAVQQERVGERIPSLNGLAVDSSGMGEETGERLTLKYGDRVESCLATNEFKKTIFQGLKNAMQRGQVKLPNEPKVIADLLSIERQITQGGTIRFVASRTKDGHADIAYALALAIYKGNAPTGAWSSAQVASVITAPPSAFDVPMITRF